MTEKHIFCCVCGEDIGKDRLYWGVEHLAKYPTHRKYEDRFLEENRK